jgi:transposase InsO family protein
MAYDTNPHLPRLRMEAVRMVRNGQSIRAVARHFGYAHSAVAKWCKQAETMHSNVHTIPTISSRPHSHPHALDTELVHEILRRRAEKNQCAEVLHYRLQNDGYSVSLSSVKRVLQRNACSRYSPWKKWHTYPERPLPETPGILVEMDTVHCEGIYLHTSIDLCSRCADVTPALHNTTHASVRALHHVNDTFLFPIQTIQTDHGSEFSRWFSIQCTQCGISHRHSRVRTPTDNGHIERFNRTLREECLVHIPSTYDSIKRALPEFLHYYNHERPHMGLAMQTPVAILHEYGLKLLT